jgi:hypothetical protein
MIMTRFLRAEPIAKHTRVQARHKSLLVLCLFVLALLLPMGRVGAVSQQKPSTLDCKWNVPVTPPAGAHLNWYEMRTDPESEANLIVCGAARDAQKNAYFGVVYSSHDGGRTWNTAIEDRGSTWVSEQSCAFGAHHIAFFVSEASKVIDGIPHHSLGTTHIFMSRDGGQTWEKTAETGWADYSSSVVTDSASGEQRLHVTYNMAVPEGSGKKTRSVLGFFVLSGSGREVTEPAAVPGMAELDYQGVYPSSSVALDDGTVVTLYNARTKAIATKGLLALELGVVRFRGLEASRPIIVADPMLSYQAPLCPSSISNSLAYDRKRGVLFIAYNTLQAGRCALMVKTSADGALSWSAPHEFAAEKKGARAKYFPILAVNGMGTLGLLWRGTADLTPGCWFFSTSHNAVRVDATVQLAPCMTMDSVPPQSSQYLATITQQGRKGEPASVRVLTLRNYLTRVSFAASRDGAFHPVWSQISDGLSQLRTAKVDSANNDTADEIAAIGTSESPDLLDVTDRMGVLYAGQQRLDNVTGQLRVDLTVENRGQDVLRDRLFLEVGDTKSEFGDVIVDGGGTGTRPSARYLDLSRFLPPEGLQPGHMTKPFPLVLRFARGAKPSPSASILAEVKVRILSPVRLPVPP